MSIQKNKDLVRRSILDLWGKGDLTAADEIMADDYVHYTVGGKPEGGREQVKQHAAGTAAAFPDCQYIIGDLIAEGDCVAIRWSVTGMHRAEFLGFAPTGKPITYTGMNFFRVAGGKLVEGHTEIAPSLIIQQLKETSSPKRGEA